MKKFLLIGETSSSPLTEDLLRQSDMYSVKVQDLAVWQTYQYIGFNMKVVRLPDDTNFEPQ